MLDPCGDLIPFIDGELPDDVAHAFRDHLRSCAACEAGLAVVIGLSVQLTGLDSLAQAPSVATRSTP